MLLMAFELVLAVEAEEPLPVGVLLADIELRVDADEIGRLAPTAVRLVAVVLVIRLTGDLGVVEVLGAALVVPELVKGVRLVDLGAASVEVLAVVGRAGGPVAVGRALTDVLPESRDDVVLAAVLPATDDIGDLLVMVEAGFMAPVAGLVVVVVLVVVASREEVLLAVVALAVLAGAIGARAAVVGLGGAVFTGVV